MATPSDPGSPLGVVTDLHPDAGTVVLPATQASCDPAPSTAGFTTVQCEYQPSYADGLIVLVQQAVSDAHFRVLALFQAAGSGDYASRYLAEETEPGTWRDVHAVVGDFNGDDGAEAWIGYRYDGTGGYLDLDILTPLPDNSFSLVGLQGLSKGVVHVRPGGADVVQAIFADSDPGCCPSSFSTQHIGRAGQQWVIDVGTTAPTAPATSSDFP